MMVMPRATVRLQLRNGVDFDAVRATLDYHAALGISHLYLSPILRAHADSTHGYDTIDYDCVDPVLGGEAGLRRLAEDAHARGMGLIVDFVPNHMGVGEDNAWWQDVQRWGRHSRCADHFDIQWNTPEGSPLPLLLPVLDRDYGAALAAGYFKLAWRDGEPFVCFNHQHYPLGPMTLPALLRQAALHDAAMDVERALGAYPAGSDDARTAVREVLSAAEWQAALAACWQDWMNHDSASIDRILGLQPYRLAHWRCADDALNWRRFFNINGLAGLRIEREDTYCAVHATILRLHAGHVIDGLRIDHVDGLAAPADYCRRLRGDMERQADGRDVYLIVEKILGDDETLPASWPVHGTTGYDFMNQVSAVLHDAAGADLLTALYQRLSGDRDDFDAHERLARREMLHAVFVCDLDMTCRGFHELARASASSRDLSFASLRRALAALVQAFNVYRSYLGDGHGHALDVAYPRARVRLAPRDHAALDFLVAEMRHAHAAKASRAATARFEQLTAPLAAKAVEDTAFYRYPRLLSRNEVGANPGIVGMSVDAFHDACIRRCKYWPVAMLATASHDHKWGEDTRMRLAALSECPRRWAVHARRWMRRWSNFENGSPDSRDVYMMLQALVGVWPPGMPCDDATGLHELAQRMHAWLNKALRESRRHTRWTYPDDTYETAAAHCLDTMFGDASFLTEVHRFVRSIAAAGALSSLTQLTLRCTTPGMPDLYQGRELWDFSMVDPDNRRAIPFAAHQASFDPEASMASLVHTWHDGRIKQTWLARLLDLRRRQPDLFLHGSYVPIEVKGAHAGHVIAFLRRHENRRLLVVVPRCPLRLLGRRPLPCIAAHRWQDTAIVLPDDIGTHRLVALASGKPVIAENGMMALSQLLDGVPVEVLTSAA
ncbi:MAG TPA: malto-oligosyltrehalose synthase [Rhodanobacteraceae bacterium]|nr:malto-oligosyltrehalose synthase [Rhodanobacteraceae bacterium]